MIKFRILRWEWIPGLLLGPNVVKKNVLKRGRWEDESQRTDVMDFADRERGHMARNVYGLFKLEK